VYNILRHTKVVNRFHDIRLYDENGSGRGNRKADLYDEQGDEMGRETRLDPEPSWIGRS